MATPTVVKSTNEIASADVGPISRRKSCHEVLEAASNNMGGRKITKAMSGSSSRLGKKGTKPIISPTTTNKMGYGSLILSAMAERPIRMVMRNMTILKLSMG